MTWIRLRQVALVVHDLEATVHALHDAFHLEVAYRDPAVAMFGLQNAVLPVGTQFVEVVSPTRAGTAGGRQLDRLGGDGGYMVICHTDDHDAMHSRVQSTGTRVAFEADDHGYRILQLHPADTGGSFLEVDFQPGGDDPNGPWSPAGPEWRTAVRTTAVTGIAGVTVQCVDVERTRTRWSALLDAPTNRNQLQLENADVRFVDGPVDSLIEVRLHAVAPFEPTVIGGVRFVTVGT